VGLWVFCFFSFCFYFFFFFFFLFTSLRPRRGGVRRSVGAPGSKSEIGKERFSEARPPRAILSIQGTAYGAGDRKLLQEIFIDIDFGDSRRRRRNRGKNSRAASNRGRAKTRARRGRHRGAQGFRRGSPADGAPEDAQDAGPNW